MPPCFDKWCQRFDDIFGHQAQKREFRNYLGGLFGARERKNLWQMATNAVGVIYHKLHHFLFNCRALTGLSTRQQFDIIDSYCLKLCCDSRSKNQDNGNSKIGG